MLLGLILLAIPQLSRAAPERAPHAPHTTQAQPISWADRVDDLGLWVGDDRAAGRPTQGELFVLSDQQVKLLGGDRTLVQSLTVDAEVDVAIRPIALDLFGFSLNRLLRSAIDQHVQTYAHKPSLTIDTGDLVDLGCRQELGLALVDDGVPQPSVLIPGNHDLTHAGTFRKGTDLFGSSLFFGRYKRWAWGPNCAATIDGPMAVKPREDQKIKQELAVVLEKDALLQRLVSHNAQGPREPVVFSGKRRTFEVNGERHRWHDTEAVYQQFWRKIDDDTFIAYLRLENECQGRALNWCREAGRAEILLTAKRWMADEDWWVLGLDSTDQLKNNPQVPGLNGSFSSIQASLWQAWMDERRKQGNPHFVLATHFPIETMKRASNLKRSGMDAIFGAPDVAMSLAGHTHTQASYAIGFEQSKAIAARRTSPLMAFVAGSTLDHPSQALRISLIEVKDGVRAVAQPVLVPQLNEPSEPVNHALNVHTRSLARYRSVQARLSDWRWRRILALGKRGGVLRRAFFSRSRIERDDTRAVMEYQFQEMLDLLGVVLELGDLEGRPEDADALRALRDLTDEATRRLERWEMARPLEERRKEWAELQTDLGLFQFSCRAAEGQIPSGLFFEKSDNCVLAIQHVLRRFSTKSMAFEFMAHVAQAAGREEQCSSEEGKTLSECREDFSLTPVLQ